MEADSDSCDDMRCMKAVFVREGNYDMDTVGLDDVNQLSGGAWPSRPWQGGCFCNLFSPRAHSHIAFGMYNSSGWHGSIMAQKSADICMLAEKNDIWRIQRKNIIFRLQILNKSCILLNLPMTNMIPYDFS